MSLNLIDDKTKIGSGNVLMPSGIKPLPEPFRISPVSSFGIVRSLCVKETRRRRYRMIATIQGRARTHHLKPIKIMLMNLIFYPNMKRSYIALKAYELIDICNSNCIPIHIIKSKHLFSKHIPFPSRCCMIFQTGNLHGKMVFPP